MTKSVTPFITNFNRVLNNLTISGLHRSTLNDGVFHPRRVPKVTVNSQLLPTDFIRDTNFGFADTSTLVSTIWSGLEPGFYNISESTYMGSAQKTLKSRIVGWTANGTGFSYDFSAVPTIYNLSAN